MFQNLEGRLPRTMEVTITAKADRFHINAHSFGMGFSISTYGCPKVCTPTYCSSLCVCPRNMYGNQLLLGPNCDPFGFLGVVFLLLLLLLLRESDHYVILCTNISRSKEDFVN